MLVDSFKVASPHVTYTDDEIRSVYQYDSTKVSRTRDGEFVVQPTRTEYEFSVDRRVPKLG
jgi:myo-inositol-1-phosphate synthase